MKTLSPTRVVGPMAAVSALLLMVGASGAWYVHVLQARTTSMLELNVASIRAAEELELQMRDLRAELYRYLLADDESHLAQALAARATIDRLHDEAQRCAGTDAERALVADIEDGVEDLFVTLAEVRRDPVPARRREAIEDLVQRLLTEDVLAKSRQYLQLNEADLERSRVDGRAMTDRVVLALLLLGACGSISGLVAGYGAARAINRSILHLSIPIRDVAGKLSEVVGPVAISADLRFEDLQTVLGRVADEVADVVDQLQGAHREMVRADQLAATGQLAAGLAHELRNPLMAMKMLVQAARTPGSASDRLDGRDLQVLEEEIARLEQLLQTFLDFAKPARLEKRRFDARDAAASSLQLLTRRAQLKDVRVTARCDDGACVVDADPAQVRQVMINLLLNALAAAPRGGEVELRLQPVAGDVELRVSDTGAGVPAENRARIFEPFFSTSDTGLGLGLAICKQIVESHGGTIAVEDRPAGGATFVVRLPAAAPPPEPAAACAGDSRPSLYTEDAACPPS